MKEFLKILYRFVPRYKKYLVLNVSFNLLAAFLTLFSFALIIPILEMLFKIIDSNGKNVGLPIGNFTSQYLANIYLAYFDHWVKEELARMVN